MNQRPPVPLVFALFAIFACLSAPAWAKDPPAVTKLVEMNKRAIDDYDTLEWKSAKRQLLEAVVEGKKAGIEEHPVMARTYLHLGAVYIVGFHDKAAGLQAFIHALQIDPAIRIAASMETAEMAKVFAEARGKAGKSASAGEVKAEEKKAPDKKPPEKKVSEKKDADDDKAPPPPPPPEKRASDKDGPDMPMHVVALDCPNTDEVVRDKVATIRCAVAATLKVTSVVLFYRVPGQEEFTPVNTKKNAKGWYVGRIPKTVTGGKSVQFYVEGRDLHGKAIVSNGNSGSPNLMLVRESGDKDTDAEAPDHEENPLEDRPHGESGRSATGPSGREGRYPARKWWLGLGAGTGFGYAKGDGLEYRKDLQSKFGPGFGYAGLGQVSPELGVHISPRMALALSGRFQWIHQAGSGANSNGYATGANAALLRLMFFTGPDRIRVHAGPTLGVGVFRFVVSNVTSDPGVKDTVKGGPLLGGANLGLAYGLSPGVSPRFSFIVDLNGLVGFPAFSAVGDVNLGLQVNFY